MKRQLNLSLLSLFLLILINPSIFATDYYVSNSGSGSGNSISDPASYGNLSSYLINFTVATDNVLNIYFAGDTYQVPNDGFMFNNTTNNVKGLTITFAPAQEGDEVIFTGQGNASPRFIRAGGSSLYTSEITVYLKNIKIKDFITTASNSSGASSFINTATSSAIHFENVEINGIQSARLPLLYMNANSTITITDSKIDNVTVTGSYPLSNINNSNTTLRIENSQMSNWKTTSGTNGYIFGLTSTCNFSLIDCDLSSFTATISFIYSTNSSNAINLENLTIKDSSFSQHAIQFNAGSSLLMENITIENCSTINSFLTAGASNSEVTVSNIMLNNTNFSQQFITLSEGNTLTIQDLIVNNATFSNSFLTASASNSEIEISNVEFIQSSFSTSSNTISITADLAITLSSFSFTDTELRGSSFLHFNNNGSSSEINMADIEFPQMNYSTYPIYLSYKPENLSLSNIILQNQTFDHTFIYLQRYTGVNQSSLYLSNIKFESNTIKNGIINVPGGTSSYSYKIEIENVDFINNISNTTLFKSAESNFTFEIRGSQFLNNEFSGNEQHFLFDGSFSELEIYNSTFSNNKATGSNQHLINSSSASPVKIYQSTFDNNLLSTTGNIIHLTGNNTSNEILVYNNTFSENTLHNTISLGRVAKGGIFHNTFYKNSGGITATNTNAADTYAVQNNLLIASGIISLGNTSNLARNVWEGQFYKNGTTPAETISNIEQYIDNLTEEEGYTQFHPLKFVNNVNPIIEKGGSLELLGDYANLLNFDQRGRKRPEEVALGSWDLPGFGVVKGSYTIHYNPDAGFQDPYEIDFSDYISTFPEGATKDNITYEIITQPNNGTLIHQGRKGYFTPKMQENGSPAHGIIGVPYEMEYKISYTYAGIFFERTNTIKIVIININLPMGIIDESILECFREMGEVEFESRYKFISSARSGSNRIPIGNISEFPNETSSSRNGNDFKYNGFSIPLVGDLDGDGKPEIVAIGMTSGRIGLDQYGDYLCILNGQTGKEIVRYKFPFSSWNLRNGGHHSSPASIALVDADRNGRAEIIVAIGNSGNNSYNYRLLCYEVNENTFLDRDNGSDPSNSNKLTLKWQSTSFATPTANWASKAIPQIVDIDGDGIPEIVVCHKIYNAVTGEEILTLDPNYIGRDPNARVGDQYIPFAYIYDVDMDGKYDIAAGGMLYYNIDIHKTGAAPYYQTKRTNPDIGDGHTAVADINGDGIPEIIVSKNRTNNYHTLQVWDPGFFEKDTVTGEIKQVDKQPQLIAYRETYQGSYYTGSHSYIYVGDIDGREDAYGNKLPEISLLGGQWFSGNISIPVHPNVSTLNGGNPFNANSNGYLSYNRNDSNPQAIGCGSLISYTWDELASTIYDRLKVSFIMKHNDSSINTGFTLFDFNNDGVQQICYRDEHNLRIISAQEPFYDALYTGDMSKPVQSYTGYEYPVVADVDGDGSADLIVMGQNDARTQAYGFVYAVESQNGDFAPAPKVWNQFMYHPLKINEDLTTPYVNLHPLSDKLAYVKEKDRATEQKTYIYNNTITQAIISAEFDYVESPGDTVQILKPIVAMPDATVDGEMDVVNKKMHIYISNHGDATLNAQTPLRIFISEVHKDNLVTTLGGLPVPEVIGSDVFVGDTLHLVLDVSSGNEYAKNYLVRVTDNSGINSSGVWEDTFGIDEHLHDCNWADNWNIIGVFVLRDDAYTIAQYNTEILDILANDHFPDDFTPILAEDMITALDTDNDVGTWEIVNNKIRYTAPATYPEDVIEFEFTMTHEDITHTSTIYIFLLQSASDDGFTVCLGEEYYVRLKTSDENHEFDWYNDAQVYLATAPYIAYVSQDYLFYAKPTFNNPDHPSSYKNINFPMGKVYVNAIIPPNGGTLTAKWKGTVDNDWHNPANWVEVKNGIELPVQWIPTHCVDVILEENMPYYPDLRAKGVVNKISMKNRSMIAKVHQLEYNEVDIELSLKATERNRFVMWSAPLKNMYTGDYHFKKGGTPNWGDVYMNYFQSQNPDFPTSTAKDNTFTATFGTVNSPLTIDQPFAIRVTNLDSDATFTFPQKAEFYKAANTTTSVETPRDGAGSKFIVDGLMDPEGAFNMDVNDKAGYRMIHVSNPFMAYLDAAAFLHANRDKVEQSYKLWNGEVDDNFITYVKANEDDPYNHFITDEAKLDDITGGVIAPLQSFFVLKIDLDEKIDKLKISAAMTTTMDPDTDETAYQLRSSGRRELFVMRIEAGQDEYKNTTILHYAPEAVQAYLPYEDSRKLFNPESPLAVYTLSPALDALAVYSSGDFSQDVKLGLRMKKAGKVSLTFSGMYDFQHEVYLIDHEDNDKVYDLSVTPELTFDIDEYSTGNYIELTNRFSLNFNYAPTGTAVIPEDGISVSSRGGFLYIDTEGREINRLQVYNVQGQLISAPAKKDSQYKIQVNPHQFYLVKGELNGKIQIVKVIAK